MFEVNITCSKMAPESDSGDDFASKEKDEKKREGLRNCYDIKTPNQAKNRTYFWSNSRKIL